MARILVIRGGAIGDFILTLPALQLLREAFPAAHIEILGYRHIVALAEGRFYADASRSIEYGPLSRFFIPKSELPEELVEYFASFHQIISFLYDPDGFFEANVRSCGARNFLAGSPRIDDSDHAAAQLARPLQSLALFLEEKWVRLRLLPQDIQEANLFLGDSTGPWLALHCGSGSPKKNWPVENWKRVLEEFSQIDPSIGIILISGEADGEQAQELEKCTRDRRLKRAHDLPLPLLAAVIQRCHLFLGHDSGISHLAASAGAPCILLFGPTAPEIWAPAAPHVSVIKAPGDDIQSLEVSVVASQAVDAWKQQRVSGSQSLPPS